MRITILAVGRLKRGPEQDLFETYKGRLPWSIDLKEIDERRIHDHTKRRRQEAAKLTAAIPPGAITVALDERGTALSSQKFAATMDEWRSAGRQTIAFLIGGADGLDRQLTERADLVMALGPMTWPHQMVRAMLAEQIYRAYTILTGHPYHRV